jgi:tol-pal system protein YbgF
MVDQREFGTLQEQVRLQQKQIADIKARQDQQGLKVEALGNGFKILGAKAEDNGRRMDELEEQLHSMPGGFPPASSPLTHEIKEPPPPDETRPPSAVRPPPKAEDLYSSALKNFSQEKYEAAVLEFEEFVANFSDHHLADNAQYWIGECYYSRKEFGKAAAEFAKVEILFPRGNKLAAALFKMGLALKELGRDQEAQVAMEKVVSKHARTEEAGKAVEKLSEWQ